MNTKTSLLVLALFSCLSAPITLVAVSLEEKYFETRDNFIRQFSTASSPQNKSDQKALSKLEKQLQLIIGPVDVADFPKRGKINLETLQQDAGFGQVDGLRFGAEWEVLFVTTTGLLNAYLQQQKELPTELSQLAKAERFYSLVLIGMQLLPISPSYRYGLRMINGLPTRSLACGGRITGHPRQNIFLFFLQMAIVSL